MCEHSSCNYSYLKQNTCNKQLIKQPDRGLLTDAIDSSLFNTGKGVTKWQSEHNIPDICFLKDLPQVATSEPATFIF